MIWIGFVCMVTQIASDPSPVATPSAIPTIWLAGDSTVKVGTAGQVGWGDRLASHFDQTQVRIVNRARGGRSSRTFRTEGLWQQLLDDARPGDVVLIQFGHNDGGPLSGDNRERGSIPGIGDETQDVQLVLQDNKPETVRTFGHYLRSMIREARDRGLTPIICTPIPRCPRPGTTIDASAEPTGYRLWAMQIAEQERVACIDLHGRILAHYATLPPEQIKTRYFCDADYTHTSDAGAAFNASQVAAGLREMDVPAVRKALKPAE